MDFETIKAERDELFRQLAALKESAADIEASLSKKCKLLTAQVRYSSFVLLLFIDFANCALII